MDEKTRNDLLKLFDKKLTQAMKLYLDTCSRCGICTNACHVYASMGGVNYIAAYRAEIVRRIYKKYFKGQGKALLSVVGLHGFKTLTLQIRSNQGRGILIIFNDEYELFLGW